MDTPMECRIMDFEEKYRSIYGCYPDEEVKEIKEVKKCFEHICENILHIPTDAITIKREGDSYGIYCDHEYSEEFEDFMLSLEGWQPIEDAGDTE